MDLLVADTDPPDDRLPEDKVDEGRIDLGTDELEVLELDAMKVDPLECGAVELDPELRDDPGIEVEVDPFETEVDDDAPDPGVLDMLEELPGGNDTDNGTDELEPEWTGPGQEPPEELVGSNEEVEGAEAADEDDVTKVERGVLTVPDKETVTDVNKELAGTEVTDVSIPVVVEWG
ncbi:hypothetical protein N7492_007688 [Penicillium capsulatum]|uniref:Uncharacterized protein n=1 Tax=Penicillium capsulatum TaxID=69766 RepID=A0A9W9I2D2_9EURO|nr:hypothetical protein N7492_007688 [Penicillium capsulatum]